jgi:uncharacterized protein YyaL (SSP411 family)
MPNRLADAVSPYLRSHADNPVDWQQWGSDAFAEAAARDVPVLISIGYSTCHWCHVMARESFSDPVLAEYLNDHYVSIKVDREEYPDVDSSYLAAASAFTDQLGWPLTVFATPTGRAFYAGTYFPPSPAQGLPSFRQVLEAMADAWQNQRDNVLDAAGRLAAALASATPPQGTADMSLPTDADFDTVVGALSEYEDSEYGGFGAAPKFPVAPVLAMLLDRADLGDAAAGGLARRTLAAMAASPLRDPVEGGFFRYSTRRDWSDPHYERMLYDNAQLLDCYARLGDSATAEGIASFLLDVLRLPSGAFASAQDSESTVDGVRVEGGYYALGATERARQTPPALDEKVLTGWNGLAIGALASAGSRLGHPDWIDAAVVAAELVGREFANAAPEAAGLLLRARVGATVSGARPTLEDYGMLAHAFAELALATGEARFATVARRLVAATLTDRGFTVPGGADPILVAHGLAIDNDPSEGAYPSGLSAISRAALALDALGADGDFRTASLETLAALVPLALERPISFGGTLGALSVASGPLRQLVVVTEDRQGELAAVARRWRGGLVAVVSPDHAKAFAEAGFELFEGRGLVGGVPTAYVCENFLCRLPVTTAPELAALLG